MMIYLRLVGKTIFCKSYCEKKGKFSEAVGDRNIAGPLFKLKAELAKDVSQ